MASQQGLDPLNEKATQFKRWLLAQAEEVKVLTRPHRLRILTETERHLTKAHSWVESKAELVAEAGKKQQEKTAHSFTVPVLSEQERADLEAYEEDVERTLGKLLARTMREKPDFILIGEVTEASAFDLREALYEQDKATPAEAKPAGELTPEDFIAQSEEADVSYFDTDAPVEPLAHADTTPGLFDDLTVRIIAADVQEKASTEDLPETLITDEQISALAEAAATPPRAEVLTEVTTEYFDKLRERIAADKPEEELHTPAPESTTVEELFASLEKLALRGATPVVLLTGKAKLRLDTLAKLAASSSWRVLRLTPDKAQATINLFVHSFRDNAVGSHGDQLITVDARTFTPEQVEATLRPLLKLPAAEKVRVAVLLAPGAKVTPALSSARAVKF